MSGNAVIDAVLKKGATRAAEYAIPGAGEVLMAKNAAQTAAIPVVLFFAMCTCSMCMIFLGTFIGWKVQDDSDQTKKKNLFNTWIAFLVLFVCCSIITLLVYMAATYKIGGIL